MSKDAAMFVVLALAVQGQTAEAGATKVSPFVNVGDFFQQIHLAQRSSMRT